MGKYMRKTKTLVGDVALMDAVTQSSLGVRTRAKTLALQNSQHHHHDADSASYLQLRSRRLEKPPLLHPKRHRQAASKDPTPAAGDRSDEEAEMGQPEQDKHEDGYGDNDDGAVEACFGENVLEVQGRERGTRESTPCNLIRDPDIITTPGSTTRSSGLTDANRRVHNPVRRDIPSANELDELFAAAEKEQQKSFIEKYNFDPVTDKPLPGRFEWEKVDP